MTGEKEQEWQKLCREAAIEQDPDRLLEIIGHINRLLSEKEQRLKQSRRKTQSAT